MNHKKAFDLFCQAVCLAVGIYACCYGAVVWALAKWTLIAKHEFNGSTPDVAVSFIVATGMLFIFVFLAILHNSNKHLKRRQ